MIVLLMLLPVAIAVFLILLGIVVAKVTRRPPTTGDSRPRTRGFVVSGCGLALIVLPVISYQLMFLIFVGPPIGLVMVVIGLLIALRHRKKTPG